MSTADDLYGLPLERFVPERTALARELRSAGQREEATEVAALRKPSVAAWAVNQLVRTQRKGVDELFEAGDALRAAHDQVLAGRGDAESLRRAVARERAAVEALAKIAGGLLTSDGHELSATIIERVSDTLHAAALDEDARASVREGRLERELRHVGLGMAPGAAPPPASRRRTPAAKPNKAPPSGAADKSKQDTKAERAAAEARTKARSEARAVERDARRRLERAVRAASGARERRDKAAQALEDAEAMLAEAERGQSEAEAQMRDAEQRVHEIGS